MKKLFILLGLVLFSISLFAEKEIKIKSKISKVTVYQQGAEVKRSAKVQIPSGISTLIISGLTLELDKESIQVKASSGVTVLSVVQNVDFVQNTTKFDKEIKSLTARSSFLWDSINICNSLLEVLREEEGMIKSNKSIGGEDGVSVAELAEASKFFSKRLTEIQLKKLMLKKEKNKYSKERNKIVSQLKVLNISKAEKTSNVIVKIKSEVAKKADFEISYLVDDAGWYAYYDARIENTDQPLDLAYKAKVYQNTKEDWEDVRLALSTGDPSVSNDKPEMSTYFLTFNNYYRRPKAKSPNINYPLNKGIVTGVVTGADDGLPIPGVTVMIPGTTIGTTTDYNGFYSIAVGKNVPILRYSFVGMESQDIEIATRSQIDVVMSVSAELLEEVVVTALGISRESKKLGYASTSSVSKKKIIPLSITKQQTNTSFDIEIPYSIPSDNKDYDVQMLEYKIPATYEFSTVPKLSEETYLLAKISNWTDYKLMDGEVNLFFNGVYEGKTFLDLESMSDTLSLSIGRDKEIMVKRELKKDYSSKQYIGSNKKEVKAWEITLKNNKKHAVEVLLEDQYPVSKQQEIKVELLEASGAKVDKTEGKLTWNIELKAGETKKLLVKYEVKYPKDKKVIID